MKKLLTAVITLIIVAAVFYFAFPDLIARGLLQAGRTAAGLDHREVRAQNITFRYLQGGEGAPLLLLHGFGADKDNWLMLAPHLTDQYRLVIPDLPGFGESSAPADGRFDVTVQAQRIAAFLEALNLTRVHVAGSSMGGQIAALLAAGYPEKVRTLALISPLGAEQSPGVAPSATMSRLEAGENVLLPADKDAFAKMIGFMFYDPPWVPGAVTRHYAREWAARRPQLAAIFEDITGPEYVPLLSVASQIEAPTLVLWGQQDQILPAGGAAALAEALPRGSLSVLPACGHLPMIEQPATTAARYRAFLDGVAGD